MWRTTRLLPMAAVFVVLSTCALTAEESKKNVSADDGMTPVFGAGAIWKKHYTFLPCVVSTEAAKKLKIDPKDMTARAKVLGKKRSRRSMAYLYKASYTTPFPAQGWMKADFDDSQWFEESGPELLRGDGRLRTNTDIAHLQGSDPFLPRIGLVCMRGRFRVTDPTRVKKLTLGMVYRGGFVAYLNGKEIARQHLPQGEIGFDTPAEEISYDSLCTSGKPMSWLKHRGEKYVRDWEKRRRVLAPIEIDTKLLKAGVNILAIEIHRASYAAEFTKGLSFSAVGLGQLQLRAKAPAKTFVSSVARPRDFCVHPRALWRPVYTADFGDPAADPSPLKIAGAKNGLFSGQLVVSHRAPIEGLKVKVSALTSADGSKLPDSSATVLYGAVNPLWKKSDENRKLRNGYGGSRFDLLLPAPPQKVDTTAYKAGLFLQQLGLPTTPVNGATVPVWVNVTVPKEARAGLYKGAVTVAANGVTPVKIPVELTVADWALPDVKDNTAFLFIYQSPDTLAEYHKVEPWSDKHWSMIEKSLKLMGEAGNIGLIFPLIAECALGNPESMVLWIRKGDGTYEYDFSRFDKYLDLALKYHSPERLEALVLNVWGAENTSKNRTKKKKVNGKMVKEHGKSPGAQVTLIDPKTKKKEKMRLPAYGTPECEALWKPLLIQLRDRIKKRGLLKQITIGTAWDMSPDPKHVAMFRNILGDVPWIRESHFDKPALRYDEDDKSKTVRVRLNSIVWGGSVPDPKKKRLYGWKYKPEHLVFNFNRAGVEALVLNGFPDPWAFRMWMGATLTAGRNGNGRVGGDFYRAGYSKGSGNAGCMYGRYPDSQQSQTGLGNNCTDLFGPGPEGPVTTMRFENARQGNQEAEARILLEKAIAAKKLPGELAKKCQELLDERTNGLRVYSMQRAHRCFGSAGWHEKTQKLYQYAAEVSKTMAK